MKKCNVSICKAACCGFVPIPDALIARFAYLLHPETKITKAPFLPDDVSVCTDTQGKCGFLTADYKCSIYEHRPEICRIFGDKKHNHPLLKCSYLRRTK